MKRTRYSDAPKEVASALKHAVVVDDFLPAPDKLMFKEENVKVTLELSRRSVRLFKQYAARKDFKYQRMIRNLVDQYAESKLAK